MTPVPRRTIDDEYAEGRGCVVCGAIALTVFHLERFPDYIACGECGSAFVVEQDGERVRFGKIPEDYAEVRRFALKEWAWPEAIARRVAADRQPSPEAEEEAGAAAALEEAIAEPGVFAEEDGWESLEDALEAPVWAPEEIGPQELEEPAAEPLIEEVRVVSEVSEEVGRPDEPLPGARYRVTLKGREVVFPDEVCAHCTQKAVGGGLNVLGSMPGEGEDAERERRTFGLPLCSDCHRRAAETGPQVGKRRTWAHVVSIIIGVVLVGAGVLIRLTDFRQNLVISLLLLVVLWAVGYTVSLAVLLPRASDAKPPMDALFVRSTLLVSADEQDPNLTWFEWRSLRFAELFHGRNKANAEGGIIEVGDRVKGIIDAG